jgi:hypothetical protein
MPTGSFPEAVGSYVFPCRSAGCTYWPASEVELFDTAEVKG